MNEDEGKGMTDFKRRDDTPLRNELEDLRVAAEAAGQRAAVARQKTQSEAFREAEDEVLAELKKFRDDGQYKLRTPGTPDEEDAAMRAISDRIAATVKERGLIFAPTFGRGLVIVDPSIDRKAREADAKFQAARQAVKSFETENAAALAAETEAAQRSDFARAISEGDVKSVRGILSLTDEARERRESAAAAMTTSDLPN